MNRLRKILLTFCLMFVLTLPARANLMWPALYIAGPMIMGIPVIVAGLIVEILFVKFFANVKWIKAIWVACLMNLLSALVGYIPILIAGVGVELILMPAEKLLKYNDVGTFHWTHWALTYIFATLITTLIESIVVYFATKIKFKDFILWLLLANLVSVGFCLLFGLYNFYILHNL